MRTKHTHKLKRHKYKNGEEVFFCVLDCSYKINCALALGKKSACNRCGKDFILDEYAIRRSVPMCVGCREHKGDKSELEIADKIAEKLSTKVTSGEIKAKASAEPKHSAADDLRSRLTSLVRGSLDSEHNSEEDSDDLL